MKNCSLVYGLLACLSACSSAPEAEPSGPIARFGSTPIVDGVFDSGEWDDAEIVRSGSVEQFRIKHDGENLYMAVRAGGGIVVFNTDAGVRVLHWSAQIGFAEYGKPDTLTQTLDKPFNYKLPDLWNEPTAVVQEAIAGHLVEHGWASNTASMGNVMQSEFVISFDWLGVDIGSGRFVEIPGVRVGGGLIIDRDDPRAEELFAMSREEMGRLYPSVSWPPGPEASDSIRMGPLPDTIRIEPADYGAIWVDTRR